MIPVWDVHSPDARERAGSLWPAGDARILPTLGALWYVGKEEGTAHSSP